MKAQFLIWVLISLMELGVEKKKKKRKRRRMTERKKDSLLLTILKRTGHITSCRATWGNTRVGQEAGVRGNHG